MPDRRTGSNGFVVALAALATGSLGVLPAAVHAGAAPNLTPADSSVADAVTLRRTGTCATPGDGDIGIQNGDFSAGLTGWTPVELGGTPGAAGAVLPDNGQALFLEGDSFLVTLEQTFRIPPGAVSLSFDVIFDPGFDLTDDFIPDAFEVQLLDTECESVVPTWSAFATSFFNVQEDLALNLGPTTQWDGLTGTVDLTGVAADTTVTLFIDLIGGDADIGSGVRLDNVSILALGGACCFTDSSCDVLEAEPCAAAGGDFQGEGSVCSPELCEVTKGACCLPAGTCTVDTAESCDARGGSYEGDGSICPDVDCPGPVGACCFDNGSCDAITQDECGAATGHYQGADTACADASCHGPRGACCLDTGVCGVVGSDLCADLGGVYHGDDTDCPNVECLGPLSACCLDGGACEMLRQADCHAIGGSFQGALVTCSEIDCPQPRGACCFLDGSCAYGDRDTCLDAGGSFMGEGETCVDVSCPAGAYGDNEFSVLGPTLTTDARAYEIRMIRRTPRMSREGEWPAQILDVLSRWGNCGDDRVPCVADLDGDRVVGIRDLIKILTKQPR